MLSHLSERLTNVIAGAAVVSPWWWPGLMSVSEVAGALLPVFGLAWLTIQIYYKITKG